MKKIVKDGMVAVLYSEGFGARWYTWNSGFKECLFDPQIVNLVIEGTHDDELDDNVAKRIRDIAEEKWSGFYAGGSRNLTVKWIKEGEQFEVVEYDGSEHVNIIGECQYLVA